MPLNDFLLGKDFPKIEPFVEALQQGIDSELAPLKEEIAQLRVLVGDAAAAAAAAAANAPRPPSVTPPATEEIPPTATETPTGEQPPATTPTVTAVVRDQLISVSVEPLDVVATIGQLNGAGLYGVGETATLSFASHPEGYTFNGWYDASGQPVSTNPTYTFTVASGGGAFTARFVATPAIAEPTNQATVNIRWTGNTGRRRLRIASNPGNVTLVDQEVLANTPITAQIPLGTQAVLQAFPIFRENEPTWRAIGSSTNLDRDIDYRPTVTGDLDLVAIFTR